MSSTSFIPPAPDVVKKGLLIGINYTGTRNKLNGCINDQDNLSKFLAQENYLKKEDMLLMNDFCKGAMYPTKANILKQFDALVAFANANTDKEVHLFFSYSGHGYYTRDTKGDELDGKDELLCPIDCTSGRFISDDGIRNRLVNKLGQHVKIFFLMDCCHSGTIVDLKYNYYTKNGDQGTINNRIPEQKCDVVMISGCKDNQTSADTYIKDEQEGRFEYQGAMTAAFLNNYTDGISYRDLIVKMRAWLSSKRYSQVPQLATGKAVDIDTPFLLSVYNDQ